ncbi:hypothetical protein VitviT2T_020115 [Vitis vinifera]|uniref:NAD-dependent epimerase/dehydratase domain-containing protein n=2 Tax=Vitis vinifera TaxID=29760 RepID=A0ABY9D528_VITVI|eukprot:XP_002268122.1 PREDICTED: cinnamoyl-CoA reductase 1 [Vitis vinifera]
MSTGEGKVVCVTGAAGFVASWLVKLLLQRGYTVRATVRDPNDPKKTEHLLSLDGAKERLRLFKADLLEEGSFDPVVDGCDGVFHTASPVVMQVTDPQTELIDPALKGTINVLRSCSKVPSVKRVVVTSSMSAVEQNGKPLTPEVIIDESWFSDAVLCKESKLWYKLSKTLAEEAAWKFSKENGIDMVMINPGWVLGPLLQPTLNLSVEEILKLLNGVQTFPKTTSYTWVDARDVANAHIQAFELPEASGRYCLVGTVSHRSETLNILHKLYPAIHIPEKWEDGQTCVPTFRVSQEKAKSLGIHFTPLEVSMKDTVESLKEKNFISF